VAYDMPIGKKVNAYRAVTTTPTAVSAETRGPRITLAGVAPNPASGSADIRFDLPGSAWARLGLYDAAGRRVRTLLEGPLSAGPHVVRWDGRNDRGAALGAGVYFARLTSAGVSLSRKIVWMP
jgi:flagellar hook assembly protein FlgD